MNTRIPRKHPRQALIGFAGGAAVAGLLAIALFAPGGAAISSAQDDSTMTQPVTGSGDLMPQDDPTLDTSGTISSGSGSTTPRILDMSTLPAAAPFTGTPTPIPVGVPDPGLYTQLKSAANSGTTGTTSFSGGSPDQP